MKDGAANAGDKAAADKKDAAASNSEGAPPAADKSAAEPAKPATRNVQEEASKANAQLTGWVFEIPAYKYDAIFKPVDELIKK
jgi:glucan-binding YG repeat protein